MEIVNENRATQRAFRALLQAMSHPGRIYPLSGDTDNTIGLTGEAGLMLVLRTLLDHEVRFGIAGVSAESLEKTVSRLTGCRSAAVADADFVIVPEGKSNGGIRQAKRGTREYPDSGATVIYVVQSLKGGVGFDASESSENSSFVLTEAPVPAATVVLKGPGIKGGISVAIVGTSPEELSDIKEMTLDFPLGIDCIFIDGAGRMMCIPRSTQIEVQ